MNTVTLYKVSTDNNTRLETLNREEAVRFAQGIYNDTKVIADIVEQTVMPVDHTKE